SPAQVRHKLLHVLTHRGKWRVVRIAHALRYSVCTRAVLYLSPRQRAHLIQPQVDGMTQIEQHCHPVALRHEHIAGRSHTGVHREIARGTSEPLQQLVEHDLPPCTSHGSKLMSGAGGKVRRRSEVCQELMKK